MIQRARLFFFVALLIAAVVLVANFPLAALMRERSTLRADTAQLATLRATNRTLALQVRALHDPANVGRIAHEEYGLTPPGWRLVVVLPGAGRSGSSTPSPLANNLVPSTDLLPSDAILDPGAQAAEGCPGFRSWAGLLAPRARQPGVLALAVLSGRIWGRAANLGAP